MGLRAKFVFLVAGILIVPLVTGYLTFIIRFRDILSTEASTKYFFTHRVVTNVANEAESYEEFLTKITERTSSLVDFSLFDASGNLLLNRNSFLANDSSLEEAYKTAFDLHPEIDAEFFVVQTQKIYATVVIFLHRNNEPVGNRVVAYLIGYFPGIAVLLFSVIMSIFIIRGVNSSLRKLVDAAQRISKNDLDFELEAKGTDEIAQLTRTFDDMRSRLKEEFARRTRFVLGVSHDLKTPLTLIKGYVSAIEDGLARDPARMNKYMRIIRDKADVLENRISHLIEFVKMETGEWQLSMHESSFCVYIEDLCERLSDEALVLDCDFGYNNDLNMDCPVKFDKRLVDRAFENLFDNAVRYSGRDKRVRFHSTLHPDTGIIVTISNSGPGIPPDEIDNIFDPFYRGTKSRNSQGAGLGLSGVKSIIESHGWQLFVESIPGHETTFTIIVPLS